ncbi:unnamed protein product, partial [Meganyctiphanes norvegica]
MSQISTYMLIKLFLLDVSPSSSCYHETLSTLRYAARARRIVNTPVVNVDTATMISLKDELQHLKKLLTEGKESSPLLDLRFLENPERHHNSPSPQASKSRQHHNNYLYRLNTPPKIDKNSPKPSKGKSSHVRWRKNMDLKVEDDSISEPKRKKLKSSSQPSDKLGPRRGPRGIEGGRGTYNSPKTSATYQKVQKQLKLTESKTHFRTKDNHNVRLRDNSTNMDNSLLDLELDKCLLDSSSEVPLSGPRSVRVVSDLPYLINTHDDTRSHSIIIYHIQFGVSIVGSSQSADIFMEETSPRHCSLHQSLTQTWLRVSPGCRVVIGSEEVVGKTPLSKSESDLQQQQQQQQHRTALKDSSSTENVLAGSLSTTEEQRWALDLRKQLGISAELEPDTRELQDGDIITIGDRVFSYHCPTRSRTRLLCGCHVNDVLQAKPCHHHRLEHQHMTRSIGGESCCSEGLQESSGLVSHNRQNPAEFESQCQQPCCQKDIYLKLATSCETGLSATHTTGNLASLAKGLSASYPAGLTSSHSTGLTTSLETGLTICQGGNLTSDVCSPLTNSHHSDIHHSHVDSITSFHHHNHSYNNSSQITNTNFTEVSNKAMKESSSQMTTMDLPIRANKFLNVWENMQKSSSDSLSEFDEAHGRPPFAERSSPLGASHSDGNASQKGPYQSDIEEESNHQKTLLHASYIFGSNTSIDSALSQPSCASLDSRLTKVCGSSNTYNSNIPNRTFFLDFSGEARKRRFSSAHTTPINSPDSPSEARRRWDHTLWPEIEKGIRRNQSVPNMDNVRLNEVKKTKQEIIEAVTKRLYPGNGERKCRKKHEKSSCSVDHDCKIRCKGNYDVTTPTSAHKKNSTHICSSNVEQDFILGRRRSLESTTRSLLPIPIKGDHLRLSRSPPSSLDYIMFQEQSAKNQVPNNVSFVPLCSSNVSNKSTYVKTGSIFKNVTSSEAEPLKNPEELEILEMSNQNLVQSYPQITVNSPQIVNQMGPDLLANTSGFINKNILQSQNILYFPTNDNDKFSDDSLELESSRLNIHQIPSSLASSITSNPEMIDSLNGIKDSLTEYMSKDSLDESDTLEKESHSNRKHISPQNIYCGNDKSSTMGTRAPHLSEQRDSFIQSFFKSVGTSEAPTDPLDMDVSSSASDASNKDNKSKSRNLSDSEKNDKEYSPKVSPKGKIFNQNQKLVTPPSEISSPKEFRRWAREQAEQRLKDSTSSEESDLDSRKRPRRRRRPRRFSPTLEHSSTGENIDQCSGRSLDSLSDKYHNLNKDSNYDNLNYENRRRSLTLDLDQLNGNTPVSDRKAKLLEFHKKYGSGLGENMTETTKDNINEPHKLCSHEKMPDITHQNTYKSKRISKNK